MGVHDTAVANEAICCCRKVISRASDVLGAHAMIALRPFHTPKR